VRPAVIARGERRGSYDLLGHSNQPRFRDSGTASEIRESAEALWKVQSVLERAGVEFIPGDGTKGPGVRLVKAERMGRTKTSGRAK
jgi:hypothetical protein